MNDKQLRMILEIYGRRINEIIDTIETENPELQETFNTIIGEGKRIKAIDPLRSFLRDLDEDIDILKINKD
jgi:hypothetical protein